MITLNDVKNILLKNRNLNTPAAVEDFFNPFTPLSSESVLDQGDLKVALNLIKLAIAKNQPIIIHGDYDVDGLSSTTILWETITRGLNYKNCQAFIPNRFEHGYGLSTESVEECQKLARDRGQNTEDGLQKTENREQIGLLVAVDCGITAVKAVDHARELGFEVLIIDHHQQLEQKPAATLLWTDKLCAAGMTYFLAQSLVPGFLGQDLAALATISDLQPLLGVNRQLVAQGLPLLSRPNRFGIRALKEVAGILDKTVGVYEVGWLLSPRLNASGRLENALDSLRLLCSLDETEARELAKKLSQVNTERQHKTVEMVEHAEGVMLLSESQKIIIAAHESYHEGIIGLVAGKLAQKYHRPAIVVSRGLEFSKGSARSVNGFNIVEALRSQTEFLENVGGHPAAAGFTIKTEHLEKFTVALQKYGDDHVDESVLKPSQPVDLELPTELLGWELFELLQKFEPFGLGNPEPIFDTKDLEVISVKAIGSTSKHLSLVLRFGNRTIRAVGFGLGDWSTKIKIGDKVNVVYNLVKNEWNGNVSLELRIKDLVAV